MLTKDVDMGQKVRIICYLTRMIFSVLSLLQRQYLSVIYIKYSSVKKREEGKRKEMTVNLTIKMNRKQVKEMMLEQR
jgi:hypothetical protein